MAKRNPKYITESLLDQIYFSKKNPPCDVCKIIFRRFREMHGDDEFVSWFYNIDIFVKDCKSLVFRTSEPIDSLFKQKYSLFLEETKKRFSVEWNTIPRVYY